MAIINLVGDTFNDVDHAANTAALRDLTAALARTAPRACAVRVLLPKDTADFHTPNPRVSTVQIPLPAKMLPSIWQLGAAVKPIDGQMVHAFSPLTPLKAAQRRFEGSQITVSVPHLSAFNQDSELSPQQLKQQRAFIKRAVKYADVLIAPNFHIASRLQAEFGATNVRVASNAAPAEYMPTQNSAARRAQLWLPERYLAVTEPCHPARLDWLINAVKHNPLLPPLVIVEPYSQEKAPDSAANSLSEKPKDLPAISDTLEIAANDFSQTDAGAHSGDLPAADANISDTPKLLDIAANSAESTASTPRIIRVKPTLLSDYGAILSGAELLVLPHYDLTMCYEVYGAIAAGVPILHAEIPAVAEIAVDAAAIFNDEQSLAEQLALFFDSTGNTTSLQHLRVLAADRSKVYNWDLTAAAIWEIHAAL